MKKNIFLGFVLFVGVLVLYSIVFPQDEKCVACKQACAKQSNDCIEKFQSVELCQKINGDCYKNCEINPENKCVK